MSQRATFDFFAIYGSQIHKKEDFSICSHGFSRIKPPFWVHFPFLEDSGDSDGEMPPLVLRAGALVRIRGLQKVGKIREFHEQKNGDFTRNSDWTKNIYRLLGGFKFYFPQYMGCHPSHWRTPSSFFKMVETTNQSGFHGDLNWFKEMTCDNRVYNQH